MALTSGRLKTTNSVARMPSMALPRPYTAQPSVPASMVTSCACVSTWMAWIVELEDTLLYLFTWCRAIMIASLSGHLPGGSPLPSGTEFRQHISEILIAKPSLLAFQRPTAPRNYKGYGYVEFALIEHIRDPQYIKNNTDSYSDWSLKKLLLQFSNYGLKRGSSQTCWVARHVVITMQLFSFFNVLCKLLEAVCSHWD